MDLLTEDLAIPDLSLNIPQWGIFQNGALALDVHSFNSFDYRQDWSISTYPVEDGGFQSYDKVQLPFDARVKITSGGTQEERSALLNSIDAIANSLELYDIVTPEKTYLSVNVNHVDYHRTAQNNVGFIMMDVWFEEIRVTATASFENTQQPGQAGQQSLGNVQTQTPPSSFDEAGIIAGVR